jgi:hypothetical protein
VEESIEEERKEDVIYELGYFDLSAFSLSALSSALAFSHEASFWTELLRSSPVSSKGRVSPVQWLRSLSVPSHIFCE